MAGPALYRGDSGRALRLLHALGDIGCAAGRAAGHGRHPRHGRHRIPARAVAQPQTQRRSAAQDRAPRGREMRGHFPGIAGRHDLLVRAARICAGAVPPVFRDPAGDAGAAALHRFRRGVLYRMAHRACARRQLASGTAGLAALQKAGLGTGAGRGLRLAGARDIPAAQFFRAGVVHRAGARPRGRYFDRALGRGRKYRHHHADGVAGGRHRAAARYC